MTPRFLPLVTGSTEQVMVPFTGWEDRVRRPGLRPRGELGLRHVECEMLI